MYEHHALGYWSGLALCLTKVRSSRARCPATALIPFLSDNAVTIFEPLVTDIEPLTYTFIILYLYFSLSN